MRDKMSTWRLRCDVRRVGLHLSHWPLTFRRPPGGARASWDKLSTFLRRMAACQAN